MKKMNKMVVLATLMAMLGTSTSNLSAQDIYRSNAGGFGYNECCRATSLAPAIALGTIAIVAVVAVAVQNRSGHGHCHIH
jgi:hypothetical protein